METKEITKNKLTDTTDWVYVYGEECLYDILNFYYFHWYGYRYKLESSRFGSNQGSIVNDWQYDSEDDSLYRIGPRTVEREISPLKWELFLSKET